MSEKIKLGLIGTGIAATSLHWPAIQDLPELFEVEAVAGRSADKAKAFAEITQAGGYYTDYRELLADDDIEAVLVSYPTGMNCEIALAALEKGKHVLVEKPLAPTMQECAKMVLAARSSGKICAVGENWYYWPILPAIREHIAKGTIGTPQILYTSSLGKMDLSDKHISQSTWRLDAKNGMIVDGGVHLMAVLRQMFGPVTAGLGATHKLRESWSENDTLSYIFRFESGMTGVYMRSACAAGFPLDCNLAVFGTGGTMLFRGWFQELEIITDAGSVKEEYKRDEMGFVPQFTNFYNAIRGREPCNYTFEDGYLDTQAILGGTETGDKWQALRFPSMP